MRLQLTAAALLMILVALNAAVASAAPRHPWQVTQPPTTQLQIDYQTYTCILVKAVNSVRTALAIAATPQPGGTIDPQRASALHLASLGYARLERGAITLLLTSDPEAGWSEARINLVEGSTLLYLAALYGGLDLGNVNIECGGLRISGPLTAVLASLAASEANGAVIIVPLTPRLEISEARGAAEGGGLDEGIGNPRAEELFRQEKLPEDVASSPGDYEGVDNEAPPGVTPGYSPAETEAGGLAEVNVEDYLRSILGLAGGGNGATEAAVGVGGQGGSIATGESRFVDAVGRITLSVETLLRLAEALSSLENEGIQPLGGIEVEPRSRPSLAGLWIAAFFAALSGAAVLVSLRAADIRMALARLVRPPRPANEVEQCYSAILSDLAAMGLPRMPWEAPREYLERVSRSMPSDAARALAEATMLYERVAYGGYEPTDGDVARCWSLRDDVRGASLGS